MSAVYDDLGVCTVINAAGTLTRLGGSRMPPEVHAAMAAASQSFVRIEDLQVAGGRVIAAATGAEDGYVTAGAAAGLLLGTAACVAGTDPAAMDRLPDTRGLKNEVVVQRVHRNSYDHAVRTVGVRLVEVGGLGHPTPRPTEPWELAAAITRRTACVLWPVMAAPDALPLATVTQIAHDHDVPVLVDAAAALPPPENLRRFIAEGADLVTFSGGKALRGPQALRHSGRPGRPHPLGGVAASRHGRTPGDVDVAAPLGAGRGGRPHPARGSGEWRKWDGRRSSVSSRRCNAIWR